MALSYMLKEGLAGFRRAKFAVIASTSTMTVALVLIGLFTMLSYEAQQVSDWLRTRVGEVEIFLEEIDEPVAEALTERASASPGVDQALYISRAEAQEIFREEFGEGAEIFFEEQFLPASIRVQVEPDYANPDSLTHLVEEFQSWNRVDEVVFNQPLLVAVQRNLRVITLIGFALGTLVILASIFLVANTIRLTIYARRLLIRTMKLVGATNAFIQRPFLVEGLLQGLIAGGVASLIVWLLHGALADYLVQLEINQGAIILVLILMLPVFGMLLGWLGSFVSVRRFIRNVALH